MMNFRALRSRFKIDERKARRDVCWSCGSFTGAMGQFCSQCGHRTDIPGEDCDCTICINDLFDTATGDEF